MIIWLTEDSPRSGGIDVRRKLMAAGSITAVLEEGDDVIVRAQTKGSDVLAQPRSLKCG